MVTHYMRDSLRDHDISTTLYSKAITIMSSRKRLHGRTIEGGRLRELQKLINNSFLNCRERYKDMIDHCSYKHHFFNTEHMYIVKQL